jgi:mono/diheme cytochrome c family protein
MAHVIRAAVRVVLVVVVAVILLASASVVYVLLAWDRPVARTTVTLNAPRDAAHVRRGQYLYENSLLCWDCHGSQGSRSPREPQAGGRVFDMRKIGPGFGYAYGTNLTPDPATGIGSWSDGEIVRAIREGVSRDGRVIFPVMAYQFYHGLSDDDALALVAYLRSLAPVRNAVPARRLSFVAKALIAMSLIKPETPVTQPVRAPLPGPTVAYGEYLTWRASGCAECHTPRDPGTAAVDVSRLLAGGLFPFPEEGFVTTGSNLTSDVETGIGGWTEDQFITAVQTGVRPNGTVLLPFMPWPSYAQWSRDDLHPVWLYLRSLPPIAHAVPASKLAPAAEGVSGRGQTIYGVYCLVCHGEGGSGAPFTSVPLRQAVQDLDDAAVAAFIAEGVPGSAMPGFHQTLTTDQIMDVTAFIRSW